MAQIIIFEAQNVTGFSLNSIYGAYVKSESPIPFQLVHGEEYVIFWDSDSFTRTAFSFTSADGSSCIAVGNKMVSTGENDGDPFAIVCDYTNNYLHYFSTDDRTEHEVGVYISDGGDMVLKDRIGNDLEGIENVVEFRVPTSGGKFQSFVGGVRTNKTLHSNEVDFSSGDIVVTPRKGEVFGTVTVPKPPTLLPENIMEGVNIAGVDGTAKSGGDEPVLTKPIRFYNAYGDVLFSYSRAEIAKMTELPDGPALGNLTFAGWDHTLDELKSILYFGEVAPKYKNSSGKAVAVMIVEIIDPTVAIYINYKMGYDYYLYVDWGDGNTSTGRGQDTYTSSPSTVSHTYSNKGIYIISFYISNNLSEARIGAGGLNNGYYGASGNSLITATFINNGTGTVPRKNIISMLGDSDAGVKANWFGCENNLRFISGLYDNIYETGSFLNCGALKTVGRSLLGPWSTAYKLYGKHMLSGCASLKRVKVSQTAANMFDHCPSLEEVEFGKGALAYPEMNVKFSMLMTSTTPPTISATSPVWGTKPIYVPDSAVDTYKAASGWSDAAAYIYPASQYPDK